MNGIKMILMFIACNISNAAIFDYLTSLNRFFRQEDSTELVEGFNGFNQKIPYEVTTVDEKFIAEVAKLTGVGLSELDSCQHRVVLKLKTSCQHMNDEEVAKLAVMLLNCQSSVEGRQVYPCTSEMSIRDCTTSMDADAWNSYHLMSNRARAVCYSVRQSQFIGLTEHAVNTLMDTTRKQVDSFGKLVQDQEDLREIAKNTLNAVSEGHETLIIQQKDLQQAQLFGQLALEDNIKRLSDEKRLIAQSHQELVDMTKSVQGKLELASKQLEEQTKETGDNHKELLEDLTNIQDKAQSIFQKIEDSSKLLVKQAEQARLQYEASLEQLKEINSTMYSLIALVGNTRQTLEDRLSWITTALGGTDLSMDRLYLMIWHALFLITAMIICAFLGAKTITRIMVATMPPLNLALGLHDMQKALGPLELTLTLCSFIIVQNVMYGLLTLYKNDQSQQTVPSLTQSKATPDYSTRKKSPDVQRTNSFSSPSSSTNGNCDYLSSHELNNIEQEDDFFNDFCSPTPPLSRVGHYGSRSRSRTPLHINTSFKGICKAMTRAGTPCKITSLPGRDFCFRHQTGDSIMG